MSTVSGFRRSSQPCRLTIELLIAQSGLQCVMRLHRFEPGTLTAARGEDGDLLGPLDLGARADLRPINSTTTARRRDSQAPALPLIATHPWRARNWAPGIGRVDLPAGRTVSSAASEAGPAFPACDAATCRTVGRGRRPMDEQPQRRVVRTLFLTLGQRLRVDRAEPRAAARIDNRHYDL